MIKAFCLYQHTTADTGEVFYVGIGSLRRPYTRKNRNKQWHEVVKKHGYSVDVMKIFTDRELLLCWESFLISFYGRLDENNGALVNRNNGLDLSEIVTKNSVRGKKGDYWKGKNHREDTKLKMSKRMIGNKNRKPLPVYCIKTGKKWGSRKEASIDLGINNSTLKGYMSIPDSKLTSLRYVR